MTERKEERLSDERIAALIEAAGYMSAPQSHDVAKALRELQSHRAAAGREEVIEECARVCDVHAKYATEYSFTQSAAVSLAGQIRALKKAQP